MEIRELVETLELGPLPSHRDADWTTTVRLEVWKVRGRRHYSALVWFRESFRLRPTLPLIERPPRRLESDVELNYLQDTLGFEDIRGPSSRAVLRGVLARLNELGLGPVTPPAARRRRRPPGRVAGRGPSPT